MNRFFKIENASGYVTAIVIGSSPRPGFLFIEQSPDQSHIGIGWSYIDGVFSDTTAAYKAQPGNARIQK